MLMISLRVINSIVKIIGFMYEKNSRMLNSSSYTINPKPCNHNCGTRIYWDTSENAYLEVFTKKKHIRPNNVQNKKRNYDLFGWINIPDYSISR